jgi:hypothetical protein
MPEIRTEAGSLIEKRRMPRLSAGLLKIDSWFAIIDLLDRRIRWRSGDDFPSGSPNHISIASKNAGGE